MPRTLSRLVAGKNINATTLLATDYLNHFNEVIMLLDLLPAMPECLADVQAWSPKDYADHFIDSGFKDRKLAILAYQNAPDQYRQPFDRVTRQMNHLVLNSRDALALAVDGSHSVPLEPLVVSLTDELRRLVAVAGAIIQGDGLSLGQDTVDQLLEDADTAPTPVDNAPASPGELGHQPSHEQGADLAQEEIDKLFG